MTKSPQSFQPNGVGPFWFPAFLRGGLTWMSGLFFAEASWARHDEGYARGRPDRATCDRKFLSAMVRDASDAETVLQIAAASALAWFFWAMVRAFGWLSYGRGNGGMK